MDNQCIYIKYMYVFQYNSSKTIYIGIIDNLYKSYIEKISFSSISNTRLSIKKIIKIQTIFKKYCINNTSFILVSKNIDKCHVFQLFLKILHSQIKFTYFSKKFDDIINRVLAINPTYIKHKSKHYTKKQFISLWEKIIKNNRCPWINQSLNDQLYMKDEKTSYILKKVYFGLYYMAICQYYKNNNFQCIKNKSINLK